MILAIALTLLGVVVVALVVRQTFRDGDPQDAADTDELRAFKRRITREDP
ncbi:MAG TPA: hypothetical protein VNL18_15620 [Gemmatimonadales bacterium]|nr:hypothetical protein [Gemmatimonadales bacterium]